jgi:hypothetical protein
MVQGLNQTKASAGARGSGPSEGDQQSDMADDFQHRSVLGKGNYLEKFTRPDITMATHQCVRFLSDPKQSHAGALQYVGKYLSGMTAKSRMGFMITYAGCLITWGSTLQRESALSTTESEYMAILEWFCSLLLIMDLLEEGRGKREEKRESR